ncbi:hypothetical protein CONPUDRAFT_70721 [Coniophora puteana RWD-64-598 SS2]|uniref:Uncharacterized protein n=1 Tax=Coniophora puteana (strain RWD-64-598) TaxID=741705 RepID=A0A5M3MXF5_CONPW|nr:uncharacterized protein CONPUDRAFT_70721 [Coniophora puteana RWD-64-598 SS2]EIW83772.1 hypothetical protein CONPUDRAFT_70721 [Coniophora puteana RWD-64-598 SS2]
MLSWPKLCRRCYILYVISMATQTIVIMALQVQKSTTSRTIICGNLLSSSAFWTATSAVEYMEDDSLGGYPGVSIYQSPGNIQYEHHIMRRIISALLIEIAAFDVWDREDKMTDNGLLYLCMSDVLVVSVISICGPRMILNLRLQEKLTVLGDPEESTISSLRFSFRSMDDDIGVP